MPRNLLGSDNVSDGARASYGESEDAEDVALGAQVAISAEGYRDDTYMLAMYLLSMVAMLAATSRWLRLPGQEVHAKKLLACTAAYSARKWPDTLEATLDGVQIPTQQEFQQLGVGPRRVPRRAQVRCCKNALRKTRKRRTVPGRPERFPGGLTGRPQWRR